MLVFGQYTGPAAFQPCGVTACSLAWLSRCWRKIAAGSWPNGAVRCARSSSATAQRPRAFAQRGYLGAQHPRAAPPCVCPRCPAAWAGVPRALRGSGHRGQHVGQRSLLQLGHQALPASAVTRSDRTRWTIDVDGALMASPGAGMRCQAAAAAGGTVWRREGRRTCHRLLLHTLQTSPASISRPDRPMRPVRYAVAPPACGGRSAHRFG